MLKQTRIVRTLRQQNTQSLCHTHVCSFQATMDWRRGRRCLRSACSGIEHEKCNKTPDRPSSKRQSRELIRIFFIALYRTTKRGLISACLLQLNIAATTNPPTTHTPTAPRHQSNIYTVSNPTKSRLPDGLRARFPCPSNLFQYHHLRPFGRGLATRYARNLPHDSRLLVLVIVHSS